MDDIHILQFLGDVLRLETKTIARIEGKACSLEVIYSVNPTMSIIRRRREHYNFVPSRLETSFGPSDGICYAINIPSVREHRNLQFSKPLLLE
jgi:hypothetical protein